MTLGSLFDGAGTFPFAAQICGIETLWSSEIEPFPLAVTAKRFPHVKQLGDVTKINGAEIEPVDIITFGSPCQDLSVAGQRKGLGGERSGLFMEAVRIIKEMREKTDGIYPRYAVWENVPGAFSSKKGEDFRAVLEEICKVKDRSAVIPRPAFRGGVGLMQEKSWQTNILSHGECWTRNSGAYPKDVEESFLWQILEDNVPEKYSLSAKACQGILRRAERRGKELPSLLRIALMQVAYSPSKTIQQTAE